MREKAGKSYEDSHSPSSSFSLSLSLSRLHSDICFRFDFFGVKCNFITRSIATEKEKKSTKSDVTEYRIRMKTTVTQYSRKLLQWSDPARRDT